jgi:hypothetical protein
VLQHRNRCKQRAFRFYEHKELAIFHCLENESYSRALCTCLLIQSSPDWTVLLNDDRLGSMGTYWFWSGNSWKEAKSICGIFSISSLSMPCVPSKADPRPLSCRRVAVDTQRPLIWMPLVVRVPSRFFCSRVRRRFSARSLIKSLSVNAGSNLRRRAFAAVEGAAAGVGVLFGLGKSFGQPVQKKPPLL